MQIIQKIILISCALYFYAQSHIVIMLDPAGDAVNHGRIIEDSFERGLTLQFCQTLKTKLETECPEIKVLLSRSPGEVAQPLQTANFANRLHVDCYFSFSFMQESVQRPTMYLYHFSYGDEFITCKNAVSFCRYDQAHLVKAECTKKWAPNFKKIIDESFKKDVTLQGPYKLPIKPLIGIQAPAFYIETALNKKDDWQCCIDPIFTCITSLLTQETP